MGVAALIIAIVAAVGTAATGVVSLIARNDAAKANRDAATSSERATVAAEKMAAIQARLFGGPPWTVEWYGGDTFLLTNNSPMGAVEVSIEGHPDDVTDHLVIRDSMPWDIGAKSAITFMFCPTMDLRLTRDLKVRWRRQDSDDPKLEWTHPIPLRPKG